MREIDSGEVYQLEECLRSLAEHHNEVSTNFRGYFPKRSYQETMEIFEKDVSSGKSRIAVIEEGNRVLGFCKADICGNEGSIDYLIVLKECRGQGYGEMLLDWALQLLSTSGVSRIEVKVVAGNDAIRFYEKHGFQLVSHVLRMKETGNGVTDAELRP